MLVKTINQAQDENSLKLLEEDIAEVLMEDGRNKAYQFKKFCAENGSVSVGEMCSLKKRLCPKKKETIQTGKIITECSSNQSRRPKIIALQRVQ